LGILEIEEQFAALLSAYLSIEEFSHCLFEAVNRNMPIFGYGAKAFMLSMIETAVCGFG